MNFIHVLGSDIIHHNLTILRFFRDELLPKLEGKETFDFMVVTKKPELFTEFERLNIQTFLDKKSIAIEIIDQAKKDRNKRFFFHGQFNFTIWLALLTGKIASQQMWWHIWGADLYENDRRLKYKIFYILRRYAQKRVGYVFATQGDLHFFRQRHKKVPGTVLYFPTKMELTDVNTRPPHTNGKLTVLVGNSGDHNNRHAEALEMIKRTWGAETKVIIPMGYPENNQSYIEKIRAEAEKQFDRENIALLIDRISFNEYLEILKNCDLAYFVFHRQQGIGTICLLIQYNIPCVVSRQNPFYYDLVAEKIPFFFTDEEINSVRLQQATTELQQKNKNEIAFFYPNYIKGWEEIILIGKRFRE